MADADGHHRPRSHAPGVARGGLSGRGVPVAGRPAVHAAPGVGGPVGASAWRCAARRGPAGRALRRGRADVRRRQIGRQDPDLAVVLARLAAAFGPVEIVEVRPNPRSARPAPAAAQAHTQAAQGVLDLDRGEGVRRSSDAVDAR